VTNDTALTFTLSGISKISALPQMKLAWIAVSGPRAEVDAALQRLEVVADTYLSLNAPVQLAARTLLEQRKKIQPQLMQRVRVNVSELDRQLAAQKSSARLQVEGGWYALLRVPATQSDEDLAIALLRKTGTIVHPGHFYDFPRDGYLVISLIAPEEEDFREGIFRLLKFLV
jgi:aspartate/methionine/tyrosine aminotransferase